MEIRNLYAFLQVASTQSFTRAGQVLGYSQSNISMQIQQLEREVGAPLFDRIGRRVTLTQYGQELLPYAQRIVSTAVEMENLTRSERTLEGMLRVGMVESLFEMLFQPAVVRYHQRFPRVRVELTVDGTAALQEQLRQGQLDAACLIDGPLPQGQWNLWQVRQAAIVVVANPRHRLAGWAQVPLEELTGEEFILMESSAPYSAGFQRAMAAKGLPVEPFLQLQSAEMALRLVQEGAVPLGAARLCGAPGDGGGAGAGAAHPRPAAGAAGADGALAHQGGHPPDPGVPGGAAPGAGGAARLTDAKISATTWLLASA